jgi:hypothetical protein
VPDPATRDLRALLTHRMRLVRIRTMVKNGRTPSPWTTDSPTAQSSAARPAWRTCKPSLSPLTPASAGTRASSCSRAPPRTLFKRVSPGRRRFRRSEALGN